LRDGRTLIGYGVASASFPTTMRPSSATVRIEPDGSVVARMSATDIGTGTYTILAQIAAERFDVPIDDVRIEIGDTRFPPAAGSGGSQGAASAGTALLMACDQLREKLQAKPPTESLAVFVKRIAPDGLEARAEHHGSPKPAKYSTHAYGAQLVEVGVDSDTAEIRVRRMLGVFASGRILNAKTARSQLIGGMIMGIGAALTEESVLDTRDGSFVNHDLAEYHVPVNADIGEIDAIFLPEREEYANPLGIKGLGEVGIVGAAAAVANAVFNATGVRVRSLPITLDKVLSSLPT
jgi:xanthine dehydrogenase YagR molybdenum-binding subunit